MSAAGSHRVTQTIYRYHPRDVWTLEQLIKADIDDRICMKEIRDALWLIGGIKRKSEMQEEAISAVEHANDMLTMFEEVAQ